ncbi:MAG: sulfatase-like hydrolase/transferase [Flavobacterium sp.]|nr:sulfatase-like hydrolase/transferase [Flavobacterium sp.]
MKTFTVLLFLPATMLCIGVTAQVAKPKKQLAAQQPKLPAKPNIIYILADDLGIGDLSVYGSDSNRTPIIDGLAKSGMLFKHAYTAPLCGPSRALILTGRYAFRTGAVNQDMCGNIKPENEVMIPSVLKQQGYVTSMTGKWGQLPLNPSDFGFDDYIRFKGSGVFWSKEKAKAEIYTENGVDKELGKNYMPDVMHNHLVNWISANKNKPFFLYYSLVQVHGQILATPDSKPGSDFYADNLAYMDKLVGKLLKTLDSLKLRKNTLIVFMGDNGTAGPYAKRGTIGGKPLSGKKGEMLECGALVPTIANWPGVIAPNQVTKTLIDASDLLPTFADVAGAQLPTKNVVDGSSFLPQLLGKQGKPREWIFCELGNKWYVRDAKWKLTREDELFDMSNAPFQEKLITDYQNNAEAKEAHDRLKLVLEKLNPAGGIVDDADGSGRHGAKIKAREAKKNGQPVEEKQKEKKKKKDVNNSDGD